LLMLRSGHACLHNCRKDLLRCESGEEPPWLVVERGDPSGERALVIVNFSDWVVSIPTRAAAGRWTLVLRTDDVRYGGAHPTDAAGEGFDASGEGQNSVNCPPQTALCYLQSGPAAEIG
jgi:hypothetical protein